MIISHFDSMQLQITIGENLETSTVLFRHGQSITEFLQVILPKHENLSYGPKLHYLPGNSLWEDRQLILTTDDFHAAIHAYINVDKQISPFCWFIISDPTVKVKSPKPNSRPQYQPSLALRAFVNNIPMHESIPDHNVLFKESSHGSSRSTTDMDGTMNFITDVITRDDDICVFCGDTNHVQAVHILKWHEVVVDGDISPVDYYDARNGISLCELCTSLYEHFIIDVDVTPTGDPFICITDRNKLSSESLAHFEHLEGHMIRLPQDMSIWPQPRVWEFRKKCHASCLEINTTDAQTYASFGIGNDLNRIENISLKMNIPPGENEGQHLLRQAVIFARHYGCAWCPKRHQKIMPCN